MCERVRVQSYPDRQVDHPIRHLQLLHTKIRTDRLRAEAAGKKRVGRHEHVVLCALCRRWVQPACVCLYHGCASELVVDVAVEDGRLAYILVTQQHQLDICRHIATESSG